MEPGDFLRQLEKVVAETAVHAVKIEGGADAAKLIRESGVLCKKAAFLGLSTCTTCRQNLSAGNPVNMFKKWSDRLWLS